MMTTTTTTMMIQKKPAMAKTMKSALKLMGMITSFAMLNGCAAGFTEEFSCNKIGGVSGCASMADIRANMDSYINLNNGTNTAPTVVALTSASPSSFTTLPRRNREGQPTRSADDVVKVTVFPFIDTNGHFVDTTDIYLILNDSKWIGRLPRLIKKD